VRTLADVKKNESVLFITSQLRQREIKMAHALKFLGWSVGLIYYKSTPINPEGNFDFIKEVHSADQAHKIAQIMSPNLIHVFSGAIDDYILFFTEKKIAPVVIDLNDVFTPSLMNYCPERFSLTKKALAFADGFCARDLQVKRAVKIDHCTLPPKVILFPEYCWNKNHSLPNKKNNDEIHIVSVGTISLETYGMLDCCYLELVQLITNQDIHFHIYPPWQYAKSHNMATNTHFERDYAQFIELSKVNPYLHLHDSLSPEKLAEVLPQYDFGIISGGCKEFGQRYTHYKPAYVASCYSGRISDYLDASLPILINDEVVFNYKLLKHYGISVDLKGIIKPGFKVKLQAIRNDANVQKNVANAASKLSITKNASRLARYYLNIIQSEKKKPKQRKTFFSILKSLLYPIPNKDMVV